MRTPAVLAAAFLAALIASPVIAGITDEPVFAPVPDYGPPLRSVDARTPAVIVDAGLGLFALPRRPVVRLPVVSVRRGRVEMASSSRRETGHRTSGTASWYCGNGSSCTAGYPDGLYAAAGPALRVGHWRGRTVIVSANGRSVRVTLVDYCACSRRVLDLYRSAFSRLADPSRGVIQVSVSW